MGWLVQDSCGVLVGWNLSNLEESHCLNLCPYSCRSCRPFHWKLLSSCDCSSQEVEQCLEVWKIVIWVRRTISGWKRCNWVLPYLLAVDSDSEGFCFSCSRNCLSWDVADMVNFAENIDSEVDHMMVDCIEVILWCLKLRVVYRNFVKFYKLLWSVAVLRKDFVVSGASWLDA